MSSLVLPKVVCITGGIGSGKSLVAKMFASFGVPVFYADIQARFIMEHDDAIKQRIMELFGMDTYLDDRVNTAVLSNILFANESALEKMNALIHPAVHRYFKTWVEKQDAHYVLYESAIIFESGFLSSPFIVDRLIGVYAPENLRMQRALRRDDKTVDSIKQIMRKQIPDVIKMKLCDFVITNDDHTPLLMQVLDVHNELTMIK